jgi:hypothetical protein
MFDWIKEDDANKAKFYEYWMRLLPLQINTRDDTPPPNRKLRTYEEIRQEFIDRGFPEDRIDALLQAPLRMPVLRGDGRSE